MEPEEKGCSAQDLDQNSGGSSDAKKTSLSREKTSETKRASGRNKNSTEPDSVDRDRMSSRDELDEFEYDEDWEHEFDLDVQDEGNRSWNSQQNKWRPTRGGTRGGYRGRGQFSNWVPRGYGRGRGGTVSRKFNQNFASSRDDDVQEDDSLPPPRRLTNLQVKLQNGRRFAKPDSRPLVISDGLSSGFSATDRSPPARYAKRRLEDRMSEDIRQDDEDYPFEENEAGRAAWREKSNDAVDCRELLISKKLQRVQSVEGDLREKITRRGSRERPPRFDADSKRHFDREDRNAARDEEPSFRHSEKWRDGTDRRNPHGRRENTFGSRRSDQDRSTGGRESPERAEDRARDRAREREAEREREREDRQKKLERELAREREIERAKKRELEREREKLEKKQELERLREAERQRGLERHLELERQRELERHLELERQREIERKRELERERERLERQRELDRRMGAERQRELERQKELERQRGVERQREMERQRARDMEREAQVYQPKEKDRRLVVEPERRRGRDRNDELGRAREMEREREKERRERDRNREKERLMMEERTAFREREREREAKLRGEKLTELARERMGGRDEEWRDRREPPRDVKANAAPAPRPEPRSRSPRRPFGNKPDHVWQRDRFPEPPRENPDRRRDFAPPAGGPAPVGPWKNGKDWNNAPDQRFQGIAHGVVAAAAAAAAGKAHPMNPIGGVPGMKEPAKWSGESDFWHRRSGAEHREYKDRTLDPFGGREISNDINDEPNEVIYILGLAPDVTELEIRLDIRDCDLWPSAVQLLVDAAGKSQGIMVVTFNSADEAYSWMSFRKGKLTLRSGSFAPMIYKSASYDWMCVRCDVPNYKNNPTCCCCKRIREECLDGYEEASPYPTNALVLRNVSPKTSQATVINTLKCYMQNLRLEGLRIGPRCLCFLQLTSVVDALALYARLLGNALMIDKRQVVVSYARLECLPQMQDARHEPKPAHFPHAPFINSFGSNLYGGPQRPMANLLEGRPIIERGPLTDQRSIIEHGPVLRRPPTHAGGL